MLSKEEQEDLDRHIKEFNASEGRDRQQRANIAAVSELPRNTYHNPNTLLEIRDYSKSSAVQVHRGNGHGGAVVLRTLPAKDRMYRKKLLLL